MSISLTSEARFVSTQTGAFLMNLTTGECFVVNQLGAKICACLAQATTVEEINTELQTVFDDVDPQRIEADVRKFIAELEARKFLASEAVPI